MTDLKKFMDLKLLQEIQDQFSSATGITAITIDAAGNSITKESNTNGISHFKQSTLEKKTDSDTSEDIIVNNEKVGSVLCSQANSEETENKLQTSAHFLGTIVNQLANDAYVKSLTQKRNDIFESEISQIQKCLKEVTEKTRSLQKVASMENILSINASIEAARAGDAGVGFAVVAREFGEISKDSGDVYERIHKLVEEIQTSMKHLTALD
jgi:methyl-accepting chemotaxis protein